MTIKSETQQFTIQEILPSLAEWGFTFISIKTGGKRPDGKWKNPEDRITAAEAMERIARGSNYGIVPPEGIFIIDFDSEDAYQRSVGQDASIAESLTFKTPRGYHVVFAGDGIEQGASHTFLGQGVDIRAGEKGYIVGPGSSRPDGRYEYLSGDGIAEVPDTLRALLRKPATKPLSELAVGQAPSAGTAPQSPVAASSGLPEGHRSLTVMERANSSKKHWENLKALDKAKTGNRNDTISRAATGLGSIYADADQEKRDEVFAKIIKHADRVARDNAEIQEFRTTASNQWNKGSESPATRTVQPDNSDRYRLIFDQFNIQEFEQTLSNLNIEVRYNQETDKVEFRITDDGSWPIPQAFRFEIGKWFVPDKKSNNTIIGNINRYFGRERGGSIVGVSLPETKFKIWKDTLADDNPVRPFHGWIERPPAFIPYLGLTLDNWLDRWLVDRESPLNKWVQRAILIGIVQKVYRDPQPCRIIPVLRGEGGIGKTTLVTELIPKEFRCMFGQFQVNSEKSEMVGAIKGKFLCEAGELAGMNDSRVSIFKAFIGNAVNTTRLKYEADFQDYANTAFIIGTTNYERNVPNDHALRSRLVFTDLKKGPDPREEISKMIHTLYEGTREAYLSGERVGVIPVHLEAEQHQASEESVFINSIFEHKFLTVDFRLLAEYFTLLDFLRAAGLVAPYAKQLPKGAQNAGREFLKSLGVGITRKDMHYLDREGQRQWHYKESGKIKSIRDMQIQKNPNEKKESEYGYKTEPQLESLF